MSPGEGTACDRCLARTWLLGRLSGHLDRLRARLDDLLVLADGELVAAAAGSAAESVLAELAAFDAAHARRRLAGAGVEAICRCETTYPAALRELATAPAVLHVAGELATALELLAGDTVAVVGSRRPSPYGAEVARSLGRGLAASGITVVSGMAHGIDAAAHGGALEAGGRTVAILGAAPERPYPRSQRALHRRILAGGAAVSELPPGIPMRRWMFPARNRLIAALASMTVVVEAGERSGALVTVQAARQLGRVVGAVPGRITSPQARGSNALLAEGALVVRGVESVLDALFRDGDRPVRVAPPLARPPDELAPLLRVLADGADVGEAIRLAGFEAVEGLAAVAELELSGFIRRAAGGACTVLLPVSEVADV